MTKTCETLWKTIKHPKRQMKYLQRSWNIAKDDEKSQKMTKDHKRSQKIVKEHEAF